jgi:peptidoglycan/LPS O-acetylase OafA/YrhL
LHVFVYTNTLTRLDGIALGSLLAVVLPAAPEKLVRRIAWAVLPLSLVAVVLTEYIFGEKTWFLYSGLALMFASVLCLSINARALQKLRFMRYTGKISYGLYLLHVPVFDALREPRFHSRLALFPNAVANDLFMALCMIAGVYLVASASWYFFETPILKLKDKFRTPAAESQPAAPAYSVAGDLSL